MFTRPLYKQLYYLSAEQLWAYEWVAGRLTPGRRFGVDRIAEFSDWLAERDYGPAYLVTDLVEEDFQRHTLPHVKGKAGRALLERKLGQLFRDTPYRYATVLGREAGGRRDDIALFCALTNANAVAPWVQALEAAKIPLAGIYSLAALGMGLIKTLGLDAEHLLLVSRQAGGLRQSYFKNGSLKFSRLTPSAVDEHMGNAEVAASVVAEAEKTRQFLTSSRLMARGEQLDAVVLGTAAELAALEQLRVDGLELAYDLWSLAEAGERTGAAGGAEPQLAEQVLLSDLLKHAPASHYPLGQAGRFYELWSARLGLYGASAVTLAVSTLWLLFNLWGSYTASTDTEQLQAETLRAETRNKVALASLPRTVTRPVNMQAAVGIETLLARQAPMPAPLLGMVSAALEQAPAVRLTRLDWQVKLPADPAHSGTAGQEQAGAPGMDSTPDLGAATAADGGAAPAVSSLLLGVPAAPAQALRLEAEVLLAPADDRGALAAMTRFAQQLARSPRLQVAIEQPPLDVRPSVALSGRAGSAGAAEAPPKFILSLVWQP